jgi:hypothetical protein
LLNGSNAISFNICNEELIFDPFTLSDNLRNGFLGIFNKIFVLKFFFLKVFSVFSSFFLFTISKELLI